MKTKTIYKKTFFLGLKQRLCSGTLCACLLFTVGCAVTPYNEPDITQKLDYTAEVRESYSVDETWWQGYQNKELSALIDSALENNQDYLKPGLNCVKEL